MSLTFRQLQDRMRLIMCLRGDLSDIDREIERISEDLKKEYDRLDALLDGENLPEN